MSRSVRSSVWIPRAERGAASAMLAEADFQAEGSQRSRKAGNEGAGICALQLTCKLTVQGKARRKKRSTLRLTGRFRTGIDGAFWSGKRSYLVAD